MQRCKCQLKYIVFKKRALNSELKHCIPISVELVVRILTEVLELATFNISNRD